jgi:hypothetical protein
MPKKPKEELRPFYTNFAIVSTEKSPLNPICGMCGL